MIGCVRNSLGTFFPTHDMTPEKVDTDKANGKNRVANGKWTSLLMPAVVAAISASGGIYITLGTPIGQGLMRPNPYTSIQAEAQHKQTNARLMNFEEHVKDHPDAELRQIISDIRAEMAAFEATQGIIIKNQDRILDKLN